jgi:hypothetical protein
MVSLMAQSNTYGVTKQYKVAAMVLQSKDYGVTK